MKKILSVLLVILTAIIFCACTNDFEIGKDYSYKSVAFEKSDDLKFEDVSSLVPSATVIGKNITSIKQLESYIKDNIEIFNITKWNGQENERIYLKTPYISFNFTDNENCDVKTKDSTEKYEYAKSTDNIIRLSKDNQDFIYSLKFEKGAITYKIELAKGFSIKYYFK